MRNLYLHLPQHSKPQHPLQVIKDFATEPDDSKLTKAAHQMSASLVSHLSLITSKQDLGRMLAEPLRKLLLREELKNDDARIESVVASNVSACEAVLDKGSVERTAVEVDALLAEHFTARAQYRLTNPTTFDIVQPGQNTEFLHSLPDPLRPQPGQKFLQTVYEDFTKMK